MQIKSINCSKPVMIDFNKQQIPTGIYKTPVPGSVQVTALGIAGDTIVDTTVHGGLDQAIYLYHKEDYDWWSRELGKDIPYGMFGENLTLAGLDDIAWVIGDRLKINDVILEITAPRTPCFKLGVRMNDSAFVKRFAEAVRPGAYARVLREGNIKAGDQVGIEKTTMPYATVKEVFNLWHSKEKPRELIKKALDSPIASVHRVRLEEWYA